MAKNHKLKPALLTKDCQVIKKKKIFCFCYFLRQCGAGAGVLSDPGVRNCQCEGQTHSQALHCEYISNNAHTVVISDI